MTVYTHREEEEHGPLVFDFKREEEFEEEEPGPLVYDFKKK